MSDLRGNVVGFPGGAPMSPPGPPGAPPGAMGGPPVPPPGSGTPLPPEAAPTGPIAPPGLPGLPPAMVLNPAFVQWRQLAAAWHAEKQRREDEFLAACMTIRHDVATGYKIDIEADSTIAADEQAEKQARTEFLQSMIPMLQLLVPEAQQNPGAVPLIHALVMFGVRAFPAARSLEQQFEQAFRALLQAPPQPPPQKGNTKSPLEIASEARTAAGEQQVDQQGNQIKAAQVQVQQQKNAIDLFEAYMKAQQGQTAQAQEGQLRQAELTQQRAIMADRQALDRARLTHLMTRDATGLV